MSKHYSGTDTRQLLNLVLAHYCERGGPIHLLSDVHEGRIKLSGHDAMAAYSTLLRDGYIEHPMANDPDFSRIPVASITMQGRIFLQQGGYRDTTTYLDRLLDRAKNKPVLVWVYLIGTALATIVSILAVIGLFKPC